MRKNHCQACTFAKFGVKTRINIPHTCGGNDGSVIEGKHPYIPTREELDKYLARLKELMEIEEPKQQYISWDKSVKKLY